MPNILTCCNLLCGCIAVLYAFYDRFELALLFIVCGAVFDFCDGLVARALGSSSPIGKELDSLADCITFGFAPSAMLCISLYGFEYSGGQWLAFPFLPFVAFILAAFSAVRLAVFNIDTRQSASFIGLPTPANALLWASLLTAYGWWFNTVAYGSALLVLMMLASCFLLVCPLPMFAMKFTRRGWGAPGNALRYSFIIITVAILVVFALLGDIIGGVPFVVLAYILMSVVARLAMRPER